MVTLLINYSHTRHESMHGDTKRASCASCVSMCVLFSSIFHPRTLARPPTYNFNQRDLLHPKFWFIFIYIFHLSNIHTPLKKKQTNIRPFRFYLQHYYIFDGPRQALTHMQSEYIVNITYLKIHNLKTKLCVHVN